MEGLESSVSSAKVLVLLTSEGKPDYEIRPEGSSLEQNKRMHEWFDGHARHVKEVISKIGGKVLQENWFWPGLTTELSAEDTELHMQMIRGARNVSGISYLE